MQLFLDTADVKEIEQRLSSGFISGVTTNPTLIKKSGKDVIGLVTVVELLKLNGRSKFNFPVESFISF